MHIFILGVSCVGKSTIGKIISEKIGLEFYSLDKEIEKFYDSTIKRIQNTCIGAWKYREKAGDALLNLLNEIDGKRCVIELIPSGLMGKSLRILKKVDGITVVIKDTAENILDRICFYDIDSNPIEKELTEKDKKFYLSEIKKDITYFKKSYERANLQVEIFGLDPEQAASKIIKAIEEFFGEVIKKE